jgi:hypothetical protein
MPRGINDLTTSDSLSLYRRIRARARVTVIYGEAVRGCQDRGPPMMVDADFVPAEEFNGIIIKRGRRWLALIPVAPVVARQRSFAPIVVAPEPESRQHRTGA